MISLFFFVDRKAQGLHLPLAWTHESAAERKQFLDAMIDIKNKIKEATAS